MRDDQARVSLSSGGSAKPDTICIPHFLLSKWKLSEGSSLQIRAGAKMTSLRVSRISGKEPALFVHEETMEFLGIPLLSGRFNAAYDSVDHMLKIGPVLALLTNHTPNKENGTFGDMENFFREMHAYCSDRGYIFILIGLQAIGCSSEVFGYCSCGERWEAKLLPMPDAVYNRLHSRKLEKSKKAADFFSELTSRKIPLFNGGFLSKWEVHQLLSSNEQLLPSLPETILLEEKNRFCEMLAGRTAFYIKPSMGSQGRSICKLTGTADGWVLEHSDKPDSLLLPDADTVYAQLKKSIKKRSFIVQQALSLFEDERQKTDFRALMIRDKQHRWKVSSFTARIGDPGRIVSNLSRGGEMQNGQSYLVKVFGQKEGMKAYMDLCRLARQTAEALSDTLDDLFGELGIDLGLDENLKPWIIEVNSKPSKKYNGNYTRYRPSVKMIIDYMETLQRIPPASAGE